MMHITDTQSQSQTRARPRALFAGMGGEFSLLALQGLLDARVEVCVVLVPADALAATAHPPPPAIRPRAPRPVRRSTLPLLTPFQASSIVTVAWERGIPVLEIAREGDPLVAATLAAYDADVACVACWPRRVPQALLALPRHGWLNLHPSLLPAHRGPAPLFWTVRQGEARAGVSVHAMDVSLDGGDLLAQTTVDIPDGISAAELERRCAQLGGALLARAVWALADGTAARMRQPAGAGSYEPWPTADAFVIAPDRSARSAFNFLRAAPHWGETPVIEVAGQRFAVAEALEFDLAATLEEPYRCAGDEVWLRCAPGVLHVRVVGASHPLGGRQCDAGRAAV